MSGLQKEGDIKNWAKTGTQMFTKQKEKWKRILTGWGWGRKGQSHKTVGDKMI